MQTLWNRNYSFMTLAKSFQTLKNNFGFAWELSFVALVLEKKIDASSRKSSHRLGQINCALDSLTVKIRLHQNFFVTLKEAWKVFSSNFNSLVENSSFEISWVSQVRVQLLHVLVLGGDAEVLEHVGQEFEGWPLHGVPVPAFKHNLKKY